MASAPGSNTQSRSLRIYEARGPDVDAPPRFGERRHGPKALAMKRAAAGDERKRDRCFPKPHERNGSWFRDYCIRREGEPADVG
jgi:hypothetical protein